MPINRNMGVIKHYLRYCGPLVQKAICTDLDRISKMIMELDLDPYDEGKENPNQSHSPNNLQVTPTLA